MPENQSTDMEASLRALGAQHDAGAEPDLSSLSDNADSQPAPVKDETPDAAPEDKGNSPAEPAKVETKSTETASDKKEEPPADETPYQKAKREGKEREAKAWQQIEAEKAKVAAEKAELEKVKSAAPKGDYTPEEWEAAAANAEKMAADAELLDAEEAKQHAAFAKQAREQAGKLRANQWERNLDAAATKAELAAIRDVNSPEHQELKKIIGARPDVFLRSPNGSTVAVELFVAQREAKKAAETVSALKSQLEAVTKERDEARKATSISRSGPVKQNASDTDGKNPTERDLRRLAAEVDEMMPV